jgi:uncharacterized membrane protein required for colicin V production
MIPLTLFDSLNMGIIISKLGVVDFVVCGFIVWGVIVGFSRGLSDQLPKLCMLIIASIVAFHFYPMVSGLVAGTAPNLTVVLDIAAVLVLILATYYCIRFVLLLSKNLVTVQYAYFVERVGGGLVGAFRYVLIFSIISYFLVMLQVDKIVLAYNEQSLAGNFLSHFCVYVHDYFVKGLQALIAAYSQK